MTPPVPRPPRDPSGLSKQAMIPPGTEIVLNPDGSVTWERVAEPEPPDPPEPADGSHAQQPIAEEARRRGMAEIRANQEQAQREREREERAERAKR